MHSTDLLWFGCVCRYSLPPHNEWVKIYAEIQAFPIGEGGNAQALTEEVDYAETPCKNRAGAYPTKKSPQAHAHGDSSILNCICTADADLNIHPTGEYITRRKPNITARKRNITSRSDISLRSNITARRVLPSPAPRRECPSCPCCTSSHPAAIPQTARAAVHPPKARSMRPA